MCYVTNVIMFIEVVKLARILTAWDILDEKSVSYIYSFYVDDD
jgi:hypothetical protein